MRKQSLIATSALISGLLIGAATPVAAQGTANWGGFYLDGALGFRNSTGTVTRQRNDFSSTPGGLITATSSNNNTKGNLGATNFLGQISAGWRWAPGPVVVGVGMFIDLAGNNVASVKQPWSRSATTNGLTTYTSGFNNIEVKQRDRYGLSLDVGPNWRTHPYAKFSFDWANYNVSYSQEACGVGAAGATGGSFSNTYTGFGVGAGVRHLQTDNLYFFAEVMWNGFGSKTQRVAPTCGAFANNAGTIQTAQEQYKVSPTDVTGVIGLGYKF